MAMRATVWGVGNVTWKNGTVLQFNGRLAQSPCAANQLVCRLLSTPLAMDQLVALYCVLAVAVVPGRRDRFWPMLKMRPRKDPLALVAVKGPLTMSAGMSMER